MYVYQTKKLFNLEEHSTNMDLTCRLCFVMETGTGALSRQYNRRENLELIKMVLLLQDLCKERNGYVEYY